MDLDDRTAPDSGTDGSSRPNEGGADPGPARETSRDRSPADQGSMEAGGRDTAANDDLLERLAMRRDDDFHYNEVY